MIFALTLIVRKLIPVSVARALLSSSRRKEKSKTPKPNQLLVDISEVIKHDARTGIQRVVRGILPHLMENPPTGFEVRPVFADRYHGYRYAPVISSCLQADESARCNARPVIAGAGDIFLGLDLAAHLLPRHHGQLSLWKRHGVKLCFLVYDLLPLLHPHWFNPSRYKTFNRWLRTLAVYGDDLICISETVKNDLQISLNSRYSLPEGTIRIHAIPLGADLQESTHNREYSPEVPEWLKTFCETPFVLMVGTIEPRKGHDEILDAFEKLWLRGEPTNLVVVGKQGWKVDPLIRRLQTHSENGKRLHWFEAASDEDLVAFYKNASGLIMASKGEGYGLPIVEAAYFNKPVLARDIPVFREVASDNVTFFPDKSFSGLVEALDNWLKSELTEKNISLLSRNCITWKATCIELVRVLLEMDNPEIPPDKRHQDNT